VQRRAAIDSWWSQACVVLIEQSTVMKKNLVFLAVCEEFPPPTDRKITFDSFYTQGAKKILYSRLKSMSISALEEFGAAELGR
jgi:hypothetical protein